ncbi:MAG: MFS transporter [Firmicutes bacterium]|nr:MFS transporter [Bacillota bacterium]NLO66486.1 MFS transporter [Bacillota bacterium]
MTEEKQTLGQRLFINRDFGLLFWGRLVSQIGDGIHYFALTWLVLEMTGSGTALGTLLFASSIPGVILAPFTGVLADLWDRKKIVVSMDIVRGLILLILAAIFKAGSLTLPILYGATVLSSLCGVLFGPAISAAIPGLVKKEELIKANSLNNFSRAATMIIGPVLGAFLLGATGYFGVFLLNGIAFLFSAFSETFIRFPKVVRDEGNGEKLHPTRQFVFSFKEGFTYIWQNGGLRAIILFALVLNFLAAPLYNVVFPYFGKEVLGLTAEQYGTVQASMPVGYLVGTLLVGFLASKFGKGNLFSRGIMGQGAMVILIGLFALPSVYSAASYSVTMAFLIVNVFISGILNTSVNVPLQVLLQETVPDNYRGRVYGLIDSMGQMLVPISMAVSGVLVDAVSLSGLMITVGFVVTVIGVVIGTSKGIKQLYQEEAAV